MDAVSGLLNEGPYFSQRTHRVTGSGVWEVPWFRDREASPGISSAAGRCRRCWSTSRAGRGTCPQRRPGAGHHLDDIALPGKKEGQFIYGVKPCIGQRQGERATTTCCRLAGVRLHGALLPDPRELPAPHRHEPLRRVPPALDVHARRELREDDADHRSRSPPGAFRRSISSTARSTTSVSTTRTPTAPTSAASTATPLVQSGFQRFVQLGLRLVF